jgi:hypothetical protein
MLHREQDLVLDWTSKFTQVIQPVGEESKLQVKQF